MINEDIYINSSQRFMFLAICHYINGFGLLLLRYDSSLSDAQGHSTVILNSLFGLFNAVNNETNARRYLLKEVLKGTNHYGGENNEILDEAYVNDTYQYIISGTVFAQYGGIQGYLPTIINNANNVTLSSLKNAVFEDLSKNIVGVDCSIKGKDGKKMYPDDRGSKQEHDHLKLTPIAVNKIIQDYLWVIFPEPEEDTSIFDVNYIYAMAGLKIVRSINGDPSKYTFNDLILLSQSAELSAKENEDKQSILGYFKDPALFFYAHRRKHQFKQQNITDQKFLIDAYNELFSFLHETVQEIAVKALDENPFYKYQMELEKIISRTQMAEDLLIRYCNLSRAQKDFDRNVYYFKSTMKIDIGLLGGLGVGEEGSYPLVQNCKGVPNLDEKYTDQFKPLWKLFYEFNKEAIHQVLLDNKDLVTMLDEPGSTFIINDSSDCSEAVQNLSLTFCKLKLFEIECFQFINNNDGHLSLVKSEQCSISLRETYDSVYGSPPVNIFLKFFRVICKSMNENHTHFIEKIAKKKANDNEKQLYDYFYDPTEDQKILNFLKHFIPLYSCYHDIVDGTIGDATISCALDAVSFIPFFGVAAKYSTIVLNRVLAQVQIIAAKTVVQTGGRLGISQLLRAAVKGAFSKNLFTEAFLKDLTVATLRVADPGIEFLTRLSKFSVKLLKKLVSARFWKGKLYASLKIFKKAVMKIKELDFRLKTSAEKFVGYPVGRYTYPQGEHFFGPKCLIIGDNVAELRSLANAPYSTYVVPVKGNKNSILYRPVDFEHKELNNLFFELDDNDLLRPLLDKNVEVKVIPKVFEDDVQKIIVIVHQEAEVKNLAGVGDWNQIKNNANNKIAMIPERVIYSDNIVSTDVEIFKEENIFLSSKNVVHNVATSPEDVIEIQKYSFNQRKEPKIFIDRHGRKRKIKPKKYRNGGKRVPVREEKLFTDNDAAEYIAKNTKMDIEEIKSIVQEYQLSSMEKHRFLLTYQDFAKDYVLHRTVLPKYTNYKPEFSLKNSAWMLSKNKLSFLNEDYDKAKTLLNELAGNEFEKYYSFSFVTPDVMYQIEEIRNVNFFDFTLLTLFESKGWPTIKLNSGIRRHTQIALNKLALRQINDAKMLEPVELCFKEVKRSEDVVNLLRNIERKTFSLNDMAILKKYDSNILNVASASLETEIVYRMKLDNQFGVLDFNDVSSLFNDKYIVYPHLYFTVTDMNYLNKNLLEINIQNKVLLKDDWKLSRIQELEFLYDIDKTKPREQSILKKAEAAVAEGPLSFERMAYEKLFKPVELEDNILELKMLVHEDPGVIGYADKIALSAEEMRIRFQKDWGIQGSPEQGKSLKVSVGEDNVSPFSKRVAQVDQDFPTNPRKYRKEMIQKFEYDLSMQGTSKQKMDLGVSVGEDNVSPFLQRVAQVDQDFPTNPRKYTKEMIQNYKNDLSMQGTSKQKIDLGVSVGEDNVSPFLQRVEQVDQDFPTNPRKYTKEMIQKFEYDLSMQGTSKQRKGLEVSFDKDVTNANNKKLEITKGQKELILISRRNKDFTVTDAVNYIAKKKNMMIDDADQLVRSYFLSSVEKDYLMLTYEDFAKDYVLHDRVLEKYIPYRTKHILVIIPSVDIENKLVKFHFRTNFPEVSNSIRELYGIDFEKIYRLNFAEAEELYKSNLNQELDFFNFCHILLLKKNGLLAIKKNEVMMKQTRVALNWLTLKHINDNKMKESVELCLTEITNNQKAIKFLKDLEQKSFSFNDIKVVKKNDQNLFDIKKVMTSSKARKIVYKMKLTNQFGVLDLGYVHPEFNNKFIVFPELDFTVTKTEMVNENLLVLNMDQRIILKNEWNRDKMHELNTLFGRKELQLRTHEPDIFFEKEKLTLRGQSIVEAAQIVAYSVPLVTEKKAIEILKGYWVNTNEQPLPTYKSLAMSWVNNLEISKVQNKYKIKNTKATDAVLLKRNFNEKRDVSLLYDKMKIIYEPFESTLKEIHARYVSSNVLGSEVKFDDYAALCLYENNMIPKSEDLLRQRNIAVINLALRQSESSLARETTILYYATDYQLVPPQLKITMDRYITFEWKAFTELSSSLNEEMIKITQGVDSSEKVLFEVNLRNRNGVANLGLVLPNKIGKHVIYPSMRFKVSDISKKIVNGVNVKVVNVRDYEPLTENRIFELVDEYEKLDITNKGFKGS